MNNAIAVKSADGQFKPTNVVKCGDQYHLFVDNRVGSKLSFTRVPDNKLNITVYGRGEQQNIHIYGVNREDLLSLINRI